MPDLLSRDQLKADVQAAQQELLAIRRHLHAHPELSGNEHQTAALVAGELRKLGWRVQEGVGPASTWQWEHCMLQSLPRLSWSTRSRLRSGGAASWLRKVGSKPNSGGSAALSNACCALGSNRDGRGSLMGPAPQLQIKDRSPFLGVG